MKGVRQYPGPHASPPSHSFVLLLTPSSCLPPLPQSPQLTTAYHTTRPLNPTTPHLTSTLLLPPLRNPTTKMASADMTPRISASHLGEFLGRNIRILGRVTSLRGEQAQIETGVGVGDGSKSDPDGGAGTGTGTCTIHLTRDAHLAQGTWVEVIGKVNADLSVKAMLCTDWGTGIDGRAVEAVVEVTHRYKELFYD